MSPTEALDELVAFVAREPDLEVAVVARGRRADSPPDVRALNLAGQAEGYFRSVIKSAVVSPIQRKSWALRKLDLLYKAEDYDLEWEELDEVPPVASAVDRLENLSRFGSFSAGDVGFKRRMLYSATVLTDASERKAFFFRAFSEKAELKRKRGAALVARDGTFELVEDSIFLFDEEIDVFVFEGYVFVIRKRNYRRIFDQMAFILKRARRAAKELNKKVPIANFADFQDACGSDSRLADKILAVQERDYFDRLSYGMLKPVMREFEVDIPRQRINGRVHLVFGAGPAERFKILKLVDDDYLASTMTSHKYEVNSKFESS